ncbi:MAG: hypothetical protein ABIT09_01135 [Croceibacterium sp.]
MLRIAPLVLILAALAACNKSDDSSHSATGRVLEGTISDAMLPVDTVTSEPPLAEPEATPSKGPAAKIDAKKVTTEKSAAGDSQADVEAPPLPSEAPPAAPPE